MLTILTNCTCIYLYIHCHSFSYCKYIPEYAMHARISFFRFCIKFFNIWYICIFTYTQIVNIMEKIYAIHTYIHTYICSCIDHYLPTIQVCKVIHIFYCLVPYLLYSWRLTDWLNCQRYPKGVTGFYIMLRIYLSIDPFRFFCKIIHLYLKACQIWLMRRQRPTTKTITTTTSTSSTTASTTTPATSKIPILVPASGSTIIDNKC